MPDSVDREALKIRPLTVYLLKESIQEFHEALDSDVRPEQIPLREGLPFTGMMFWERGVDNPPKWKSFLLEGTDDQLKGLQNRHQSVLVLVRPKGLSRIFAFVFGYARSLLKPTSYETDFGLKVVMNVVDPDKLRSMDSAILEEIPVQTRKQASRVSAMELFEIDKDSDMLRALVGTPMEILADGSRPQLGQVIAGSATLALRIPILFEELGDLGKELIQHYEREDYREHGFEWVDHLQPVKDKELVGELDCALLAALKSQDTGRTFLAPPEIIEWENFAGIRFGTAKKPMPAEFEIEELYLYMRDPVDWDIEKIKSTRVSLVRRDGGPDDRRFTIYRCLLFDHSTDQGKFVLTNGSWFSVEPDFSAKVAAYVAALPEALVELPDYNGSIDQSEGDYSTRVCISSDEFALMDKKLVKPTGGRTWVEVCDIFTKAKQFVHIKPFKASSTLSHLFSQGSVSSELFQIDPGFRREARNKVRSTKPALHTLIPAGTGQADVRGFEVVYAIIWKNRVDGEPWQTALPFFAQLNLMQTAQRLRMRGFNVAVRLIVRA